MIYKICSSCGRKIQEGTECPCRKLRKAAGDRQYDRYQRDAKAAAFYRSAAWLQTRARILNRDQIDVYMYMTQGLVVPADTVHHIVPLRDDWTKRLDPLNLMSLNHETHSMIERSYIKSGGKKMARTLKGMLQKFLQER